MSFTTAFYKAEDQQKWYLVKKIIPCERSEQGGSKF
jgi:hypothetical protein